MPNKKLKTFIVVLTFIILFANLSLAQEENRDNLQKTLVKEIVSSQFESEPAKIEEQVSSTEQTITNNDHEGKRIKKIEYRNGNSSDNETTYYSNSKPADFIQVRNASGIFNFTYYYLNDKMIASKFQNGDKLYYHPDHLGSTTLVTNQSGDVVEDDVYLPFGAIYSGLADSRFLFTGKERDETGFDYFGARYYNPLFMHFLQADPIISDVYDPQNLNRYSYVLNNPYKYTDPTGNVPVLLVTAGIGAGIGAVSSITIQLMTTGEVNARQVAVATGAGAIAGLTGFGAAAAISSAIGSSAGAVAVGIAAGAGSGVVGGEAAAYAESTFTGQDYEFDAARAGVNAVVGGITGGIGGKLAQRTSYSSNQNKIIGHFERHGKSVDTRTLSEYNQKYQDFFNAGGDSFESYTRSDGTIVKIDKATGTFGVKHPDKFGTFYRDKPDKIYKSYLRDKYRHTKKK